MRPPTESILLSPAALVDELCAATGLAIGDAEPLASPLPSLASPHWLRAEGYALSENSINASLLEPMARAVIALREAGWPGVFAFIFDAFWQAGHQLERVVSEALGVRYDLLADAWAWAIPPGQRGWKPHRGGGSVLFDRQLPELVTVWLALSDATAERACMYVVPLHDDPSYPQHLDEVSAPVASARAIPVSAGTAVVWNANLLHWGGACSARAIGPRVSCSFSLGRSDAPEVHRTTPIRGALPVADRLDFIATQIEIYASQEADLAPSVREWARATVQLRQKIERLRNLTAG